jgi:hypothetical protein
MDTEIRARVQAAFADAAARYDLSALRGQKSEIISSIRGDVTPFFKDRGISITTLGMFGGLTYENPEIQQSIDKVFIAQREKEISAAMLEAQNDKNKRIEMEAVAKANAAREVGRGEAEAKKLILEVAEAAAQNPVFLPMRQLEVEEARIQKWDGRYPSYYMMMGGNGDAKLPTLMLQVPSVNGSDQHAIQRRPAAPRSVNTPRSKPANISRNDQLRRKIEQQITELHENMRAAKTTDYRNKTAAKIRALKEQLTRLQ